MKSIRYTVYKIQSQLFRTTQATAQFDPILVAKAIKIETENHRLKFQIWILAYMYV